MNKIIPLLLAVGCVFAQEPIMFNPDAQLETPAAVVEPPSTPPVSPAPVDTPSFVPAVVAPSPAPVALPSPAPVAAPVAPKAEKTVFDALRGHAYNPYQISGAASSVKDLVWLPSEINGQRFAYISPSDRLGYAAFGGVGGSFLLGLDNSPVLPEQEYDMGALILGYANSAFGVALNVSIHKDWIKTENKSGVTESKRETYEGDNLGLYFSMPLGGPTIYANANWLTYQNSGRSEIEGHPTLSGNDIDEPFNPNGYTAVNFQNIGGQVGVLGSIGSLKYDASLIALRHGGIVDSDQLMEDGKKVSGKKVVSEDSYLVLGLGFNIGLVAVQNEMGRVIIGANNIFAATYYDEIETWQDDYKAGNVMELAIAPNILTEWILMDNLLAFGGAMHPLYFNFGGSRTQARNEDISRTIVYSIPTEAFMGLRYQKTNWALEASFSTHPFEALAGNNIFANFGGFVYF